MDAKDEAEIVTHEMFGVPVDFEILQKQTGDTVELKISYVAPVLRLGVNGEIVVFAPPRMEKPVTEREKRLFELFGF